MNETRLRTILLVAALYHLALGAFMFFAPGAFYDTLGKYPPRNDHYVKDVSTFYIALGVGFYISRYRRSWRVPLLFFATVEYALHAVNHLIDVDESATAGRGWFAVFSLSLLALILAALTLTAWRVRPEVAESETPVEPRRDDGRE